MARVLTDIVRPDVRQRARRARAVRRFARPAREEAPNPSGPTSLTVFFDGAAPRTAATAAALRTAFGLERPDILWRDLRRFPYALTCWHVAARDWRGRLYVVDRAGALRRGHHARRLLWRELALSRGRRAVVAAVCRAAVPSHHWLTAMVHHGPRRSAH